MLQSKENESPAKPDYDGQIRSSATEVVEEYGEDEFYDPELALLSAPTPPLMVPAPSG